jgi:hypothetical protein
MYIDFILKNIDFFFKNCLKYLFIFFNQLYVLDRLFYIKLFFIKLLDLLTFFHFFGKKYSLFEKELLFCINYIKNFFFKYNNINFIEYFYKKTFLNFEFFQ